MKITRNFIIIFLVILVVILGTVFYFLNANKNNNNTFSSSQLSSLNQSSETSYLDIVSKVELPTQIDFSKYKTINLADGRQVLSIPKELLTREPFATAISGNVKPNDPLRDKLFFFYNPLNKEVTFTSKFVTNFETITINNKEFCIYSLSNTDGTENLYYSPPDLIKLRDIKDFKSNSIIKFEKIDKYNIQVTVNTVQRGQKLVRYNIDFTNAKFTENTTNAEFTDTPPKVTSVPL